MAWICFAPNTRATTIVVVRTPTDVSIASDSLGTFDHETKLVCKIHRSEGVFLGVAGIDNDSITKFSVAKVVFRSIRHQRTFTRRMRVAVVALRSALLSEALALKTSRPGDFANLIDPRHADSSIVLFGLENGSPVAIAQSFHVGENADGVVSVNAVKTVRCPGTVCPGGYYTFLLGRQEAIQDFAAAHPGAQLGTSADGAKALVQIEIDAHAEGVGPPIDILRISASGPELIQHKEGCPIDEASTQQQPEKQPRRP